jgi:hypothetical protein
LVGTYGPEQRAEALQLITKEASKRYGGIGYLPWLELLSAAESDPDAAWEKFLEEKRKADELEEALQLHALRGGDRQPHHRSGGGSRLGPHRDRSRRWLGDEDGRGRSSPAAHAPAGSFVVLVYSAETYRSAAIEIYIYQYVWPRLESEVGTPLFRTEREHRWMQPLPDCPSASACSALTTM